MKTLMFAFAMTAVGLMAAQTNPAPDSTSTTAPAKHGKFSKFKKHRKAKKTTAPAQTPVPPAK
ncbi:MAG: hypothetical protein ABL967_16555 [Bryobacteraceae bacterium]